MRIMVLGGSNSQLDLIKRLKAYNDEVVLLDYSAWCVGKLYADYYVRESTFDIEAVLKTAKKYQVEAIMTIGTDQPVYSAAVVSQKLGLKFYADETLSLMVTNKRIMKGMFVTHDIPTSPYRLIVEDFADDDLDGFHFPAVIKPVDSQGQRGVFLVNSVDEIREYIANTLSFSREEAALIEEYYENDELTVNGWVAEGELTILSVVDRVTFESHNHIGICLCHNAPSIYLKDFGADIDAITEKIVKAFNIKNGPIYFQYLLGRNGIIVNEIAMRIGGAYESLTIPLITGIDILKMNIDFLKGIEIDKTLLNNYQYKAQKRMVSTQLFFARPGKIKKISGIEAIQTLQFVEHFECFYKVGDCISEIENATARAGYFVVTGEDYEDMIQHVNCVFEMFSISDDQKNMVITYNDYINKYKFINRRDL